VVSEKWKVVSEKSAEIVIPSGLGREGSWVYLSLPTYHFPLYFTFSTTTAVPYASTSVTPFMISVAS